MIAKSLANFDQKLSFLEITLFPKLNAFHKSFDVLALLFYNMKQLLILYNGKITIFEYWVLILAKKSFSSLHFY